jgi:magnesium chelatase family protein
LDPVIALSTVDSDPGESTAVVRARVLAARAAAAERWADNGWRCNAEVPGPVLRGRFRLPRSVVRPLDEGLRRGELTARGADRALRVAWTLADLAGRDRPDDAMVDRAILFKEQRAA